MSILAELSHVFPRLWRGGAYSVTLFALLSLLAYSNAVVFSIIYTSLLKPLPYSESEQLAVVRERLVREFDQPTVGLSHQLYSSIRETSSAIVSVALVQRPGPVEVKLDEFGLGVYTATRVTNSFFQVLQPPLSAGRWPDAGSEEAVVSPRVAARLPSVPAAVTVGGRRCQVVGVLKGASAFPPDADIWLPYGDVGSDKGRWGFTGLVRIREGFSKPQAKDELAPKAAPPSGEGWARERSTTG